MPRFEHDGISHYYTESGRGFPLVFVHGLGLSHQGWIGQVPVFARRYRVVTYDCRGHGGTGVSEGPLTIRTLSEDLRALLDHLSIKKAVLVGYSTGTLICESLALDHPERVAGLCLIGAYSRPKTPLMKLKNNNGKLAAALGLDKMMAYSVARHNAKNVLQRGFFFRIAKQVNREEALRIMKASERFHTAREVSKIACPVLLVRGKRDFATKPYADEFVKKMPHARLVEVEGSNHAVATKRETEFNHLLKNWLESLNLPSPTRTRADSDNRTDRVEKMEAAAYLEQPKHEEFLHR